MTKQFSITLPVYMKGFHLITDEILKAIPKLPDFGLLHVFIQHTSAGLALNENADSTVRHDLDQIFNKLAPENESYYQHTSEGADDMPAHMKSVLVGSSISVPITNKDINLGTWQGIYLCEFRKHAPARRLIITILS